MYTMIIKTLLYSGCLLFTSCIMGPSVKGDGNVKEEIRQTPDFHGVSVTSGMNVILLQGDQKEVRVIADKNLHELIETYVEDGILKIRALASIRGAKEKKVQVTVSHIDQISATAGSNITTGNQLTGEQFAVKGSAGSNLNLDIKGENAMISASSGSNLHLEGEILELTIKTSSGANIKAGDLTAEKCVAKASSGGNMWIHVKDELTADASSGGNIFYSGAQAGINISTSSGGNIIRKN